MSIRFYNGLICTMESEPELMEGELWTDGSQVAFAGPAAAAPERLAFEREINLGGNLLLPGFKNAHTHSAMTFLRSYADDLPLQDWLEKQVFPMEAKLAGEDVYWLSKLAILEYLTSGVTANFDMYMFPHQIARASVESGFRTVLCGVLHNFIGSLEELEENYQAFNHSSPLIGQQLSFHAEYTCSRELLEGVAALARKYKAPVYAHNSETRAEVEQCLGRTGMTPTVYMDSLGLFQYGGGGYHCTHLTAADLEIFKGRGLYAVSNPGSNTKLASGIAPVSRMLELGIPVALGTDGPASNNSLDMFREMFLVTGLQKLETRNAAAVPADEVLKMACVNGARAMGLDNCDSLAAGKQADLIVIDLQQPNMQPLNHPLKNLVYSGSKQNVKLTMVAGKVLYEDGNFHVGEEPAAIYKKANEIIGRMA